MIDSRAHAAAQPGVATLQQWVRLRAKQGGFPRLSAVHLVSSVKGTGVQKLLQDLRGAAGAKGNVWVVGAQVRRTDILLVQLTEELLQGRQGAAGTDDDASVAWVVAGSCTCSCPAACAP